MEVNNKATPVLIIALILFAFVAGSLWTKVRNLEEQKKEIAKTEETQKKPEQQAQRPEEPSILGAEDQAAILKDPAAVKGVATAKVTIVEFSEYQCPFCKRYVDESMVKIMAEYGDKIQYLFHDVPLPMHSHAQEAAEAARCAGDQGKYWEYHDKLFAVQEQWSVADKATEKFITYSADLGLDSSKFKECLSSGKYTQVVKSDSALGQKVGVSGTPSFFINGRMLVGAQPYESFRAIIEEELKNN